MKRIFITIMAVAAVLASCDTKEVETRKGEGTFMLQSLTANTDLNDVQVGTKALPGDLNDNQLIAAMELTIKNTQDANLKQTFNYLDIVNKPVQLATGSYTVSAVSTGGKDAAWDQPLFAGTKNFEVKPNTVSPVKIECALTNAVVSIKCSDTFTTEVSDYNIKVSDAKGNFLTWTRENIGNDGYFTAKELNVTIEGKRSLDGNSTATVTGTIKDIQAKDHITLNIDARVTGQVQQIVVSVDKNMTDKYKDIFVDGFEEIEIPDPSQPDPTPNPEEPKVDPDAPSLVWEANPTFAMIPLKQKMDVDVKILAPKKIKSLLVKVKSDVLFDVLPDMVSEKYVDSGNKIVTLDLIDDPIAVEKLSMSPAFLPTGDNVKEHTELSLPLSKLVPMIGSLGPDMNSIHYFTLILTDEADNVLEKELAFQFTEEFDKGQN